MHILLDYRPALRQRTGVGEYVHHLSSALLHRLAAGDRVTLFSSSWKDRLGDVLPGADRRDLRIPVRLLNLAWHRLEWPPVETFGVQPDVAWSLHPLLMPARRAARVVTIYDLYFLDHPEDTDREIRRDYPALAAEHARRADGIVTISEYTRDVAAARFGVPAAKIAVCYPGAPRWKPRPSVPASGPILHMGTIGPRKNVGALLRAYAELVRRDSAAPPLVFAGQASLAPAELLRGVPSAAADRVRFLGYVPDAERQRLYNEAAVLVMPSTDEGFGMPAVEAMAAGVPVIAARRGALPEVVGDAGVLIDPEDTGAFADALARVLGDAELRGRLAVLGPHRAARFDWDASAARLIEVFASACASRRSRG